MFSALNKVKNGPKRPYNGPKGLKMHKKKAKKKFLDLKRRFFSLAELGGTPTPPLTEKQCEKKKVFFLNGIGGYPPPLNGQNPLKRF